MYSQAKEAKLKVTTWLRQTKKLCTAKEAISKMKIQATKWQKILAHHVSISGWYSKFIKNNNNFFLIKKWAEVLNKHSSKAGIQIANRHIRRFSTSLVRKVQLRTTKRYHFIPIRIQQVFERMCKKGNPHTLLVAV